MAEVTPKEFDDISKLPGVQTKTLEVSAGNGSDVLRGMVPMFEMIVDGECKDDEEARKTWWRGFCVAAHIIALEHIGWDEGMASLKVVAEVMKARYEAGQMNTN